MFYILLKYFLLPFIIEIVHGKCPPDDWKSFGKHCYKVFTKPLFFSAAEDQCVELGGHLVSIHSQSENEFVFNTFVKKQKRFFWIGLTDRAHEGTWKWTDRTPSDYKNWMSKRPDNVGNADCAFVFHGARGKWDDSPCDGETTPKKYICKVKAEIEKPAEKPKPDSEESEDGAAETDENEDGSEDGSKSEADEDGDDE